MKDVLGGGSSEFECRVSSVLNRNVKEFGKKFLFDGRVDTCWNSDQGSPQFVLVVLEERASVSAVQLMFQGGFVGKECTLEAGEDKSELKQCFSFSPEDSNKLQTFQLPEPAPGRAFKIVFKDSSDFFGRVTVYQLKLLSPEDS